MLRSKSQIIDAVKTVARVLGSLNPRVVYVGGAVTGLYANDPAAPEVRPTRDIDIVLKIASHLELENIRQQLERRGIRFAPEEKVVCRFRYQNILLDVMATREIGWAPANPWFKAGFDSAQEYDLEGVTIKIMPLSCFLATKFAAFRERGGDPRTSRDFEDIVYILDNRTTFVHDILTSGEQVKRFLIAELRTVLYDPAFQEAVLAHLEPATQTERYALLNQKIIEIIEK